MYVFDTIYVLCLSESLKTKQNRKAKTKVMAVGLKPDRLCSYLVDERADVIRLERAEERLTREHQHRTVFVECDARLVRRRTH